MAVSVVTGATSGIGQWIALGLAAAGHEVVLVARSRTRGDATRAWIASRAPNALTSLLVADLSSLAATRQAGMLIDARYPTIDLLVNNAGVFTASREMTEEGHERVLATNHLSPFVLTRALVPALRAAAAISGSARIVNVGSSMSDRTSLAPEALELGRRWARTRAYSQSKLALMMASFGWARRLAGSGVVSNVVHPGMVATNLVRAGGPIGLVWRGMAPFMLTEEQGADTPLHAALAPDYAGVSGLYLKKRRPVAPNPRALDAGLLARVWAETERLTGG